MTSYIVRNEIGQSLQLRPFDRKWTWTNSLRHASTFSADDAYAIAHRLRHGDVDEAQRTNTPAVMPYEWPWKESDAPHAMYCLYCGLHPTTPDDYPYCSAQCGIQAELEP